MAYQMNIKVRSGNHTTTTTKTRLTAAGVQKVKDDIRAKVARGSVVDIKVREV